jgi:hypothetical protein
MDNKKENANCSLNVTLPVIEVAPPTEKDGYLSVARDFQQGVEALSFVQKISPRSCSMLAGFALECALKAFLLHKGKDPGRKHDLMGLWKDANQEGLEIPETLPTWAAILADGHGHPYYFRYQRAKGEEIDETTGNRIVKEFTPNCGFHPPLNQMGTELKKLIGKVESACRC